MTQILNDINVIYIFKATCFYAAQSILSSKFPI